MSNRLARHTFVSIGVVQASRKITAGYSEYDKNRGQGMLLNMMCGRRLSAISLCTAVTFAPLFNAQADEPEVIPGDSPVAVSEQGEALPQAQATAIMAGIQPLPEGAAEKARTQIESQLPAGYKPVYLNQLQLLYAARDMQPMWENRDAVKAFQQQRQRWRLPVSSRSLING